MDDMHFWSTGGLLTSLHLILMETLTNYHAFSQSENDKDEKDEADKKEKAYFKYLKMCILREWKMNSVLLWSWELRPTDELGFKSLQIQINYSTKRWFLHPWICLAESRRPSLRVVQTVFIKAWMRPIQNFCENELCFL